MPGARDAAKSRIAAKGGPGRRILSASVVFLVFSALKYVGFYLTAANSGYPLVSASIGFGIAAVVALGYDYIAVVGLAAFLLNLYSLGDFGLSIGVTAGNVSAMLLAAYFINRLAGGGRVFDSVKSGLYFILLGALGVGVGALIITGAHFIQSPAAYDYFVYFFAAWLSDVIGMLIVVPAVLLHLTSRFDEKPRGTRLEEALIVLTALILGAVLFGPVDFSTSTVQNIGDIANQPYLYLLPVIWAAMRTTRRRAAYTVVLVSVVAVGGTMLGYSPFAPAQVDSGLQVFLIVIFAVNLVLSTTSFERHNAIEELARERDTLARRVERRTAELLKIREREVLEKVSAERAAWRRMDRVKSFFLAVAGHELRTPITPIMGQLELLQGGYFGRLGKKQRESVDMALRSAHRLDGLTRDFLEVTKIQASVLRFGYARVDIKSLVDNSAKEESGYLPEKGIKVVKDIETLPKIRADPDRLAEVLKNLLDNAKKFSPEGSTVTVTAGPQGRFILFSVKDTGIGISEKNRDKVFSPFFQADAGRSRAYGGTGLGLAICKGIVESQGGRIWFESAPGVGTTFYFTVPLKPPRAVRRIDLLPEAQHP